MNSHFQFWGKAQPEAGSVHGFHPIVWHGLDIATVLEQLLKRWPHEAKALAECFEAPWDAVHPALLMVAALHDFGKFAPAFQMKVPDLGRMAIEATPEEAAKLERQPINHGEAGWVYIRDERFLGRQSAGLFENVRAADEGDFTALLQPVFGHHGKPLDPCVECNTNLHGRSDSPSARAAREAYVVLSGLFGDPAFPSMRKSAAATFSLRFAGLMTLADWLGSQRAFFPYAPPGDALAYWQEAGEKAVRVVAASGLLPTKPSTISSMEVVTGGSFVPTDAQRWAEQVSVEPAGLYILEDVMGSGKTEAALILAHRLMQAGHARGLYIALPTMATANALYRRMAPLYRRLFSAQDNPSLVLAHGARDLDPAFRASLGLPVGAGSEETDEDPSDAACARWLADDRRKTFLADVGVGTIDQALLGVMPVKHGAIRQLGLRQRVLIVDEVHSYDSYVGRLLETLVAHQAMMDAPVILLSATLPSRLKARLARAWGKARRRDMPAENTTQAYPLATAILSNGVQASPLTARADLVREVQVRRLADHGAADALVIEAAAQGAAVARLCNTVDEAIATYERLIAAGVRADLFHARFAMKDRIEVENRVLARFGKHSRPEERRGCVLIATQVIEMSLDLDFDLMVSDLAPIDVLMQRAGRVWRHAGRQERGWPAPELAVLSPDPAVNPDAQWVARLFPKGQYVYQDHARLWRTAREAFAQERLHLPAMIRPMIETVYAEEEDDIPEGLRASMMKYEGKSQASRSIASYNVLVLEQGYSPDSGAWTAETHARTRESEERTLVRLARIEAGKLVPYAAESDPRRAWALSEVSISKGRIAMRGEYPPAIEAAARQAEAAWERDNIRALCLPLMGEGGEVNVLCQSGKKYKCVYSLETGLRTHH